MIRGIIFDCFGVLYRDNLSMLYDAVPPENHQALKDIIHATDYGYLDRQEYYSSVAELANKTPEDIRAIELRQHVRDDDMVAYCQSFKPKYKVGLLSNVDSGSIRQLFPNHDELFDAFVVSGDIGVAKPTPEIFEHAAAKMGLRPEECVMIDDIQRNVEGAQMTGMYGIVFTSRQQLEKDLAQLLEAGNA